MHYRRVIGTCAPPLILAYVINIALQTGDCFGYRARGVTRWELKFIVGI